MIMSAMSEATEKQMIAMGAAIVSSIRMLKMV